MAVLGGAERRGRWRVPEHCTAVAMMGGCVLDLRAAQLSAPVTTLTVVTIMGGVAVRTKEQARPRHRHRRHER